jgi:hypothetical protein
MRIGFDVAGTPAEFSWRGATGRVELRVGDDAVLLESPFWLSTTSYRAVRTIHVWHAGDAEHVVELVKVKPRLKPGPCVFTISVDSTVVARATGT